MGALMIKCPTTGHEFSTGIQIEEDTLERLPETTARSLCAPRSTSGRHGNLASWRVSARPPGLKRWPRASAGAGSSSPRATLPTPDQAARHSHTM
jgi:hypothetical protein